MRHDRSRPVRARVIGAVSAAALIGGGLVAGMAPHAAGAGFDAATLCPASAPSSAQVGALLERIDQRALTLAAGRLSLSARSLEPLPGARTRSAGYSFVGDRASGRSRWSSTAGVTDADGLRLPALDTPWVEHAEDTKKRRHYRLIRESDVTSPLDWAALAGRRQTDLWLRTTAASTRTWPLKGYRPLLSSFAGRVRSDLAGATFTCTVDSTDPGWAFAEVVATRGADARRLSIWLRETDGAPDRFSLTRGDVTDQLSSGEWGIGPEAGAVEIPSASISPATYRTAVTRALAGELRDGYVVPEARAAVARGRTVSKRVSVLRSVSAKANARFLRELRDQGATSVRSTAKKITNGKRYTIRYGDAAATIRFTVKGTRVSTATSVTASSSTAAPAVAHERARVATERATATGSFDVGTLCPAEPTFDRMAAVLNKLQGRMWEKSNRTGVSTLITRRSHIDSEESWTFAGDPVTDRALAAREGAQVEDGYFPYLDEATYADPRGHRSFRLISHSHEKLDRVKSSALARLDLWEAWERAGTNPSHSWTVHGYLYLIRVHAYELLLGRGGAATYACSTDGSTLTVTVTEDGREQTLKIRVDDDGAPVSFVLPGREDRDWDESGTVVYQRPRLFRPVVDYSAKQVRRAAVGGAATHLRSEIVEEARQKVAKATTTAKRVAALRTIAARVNGEIVDYYNSESSISFLSTAKKVTSGTRYTLRVGPDAIGSVTFMVKGRKIVTKTVVPPRP